MPHADREPTGALLSGMANARSQPIGTLGAELFLISTDVDRVYLNYNRPGQMGLDHLEVNEVKRYLAEGHFLKGSMEPKMRAVIDFIENGGERAIITSPELIPRALKGKAGTTVSKRRSQ